MNKVKPLLTLILIFLFSFAFTKSVFATTYYVSNSSELNNRVSSAQPGDEIVVANGNYSGFNLSKSGTSSAPITIKAQNLLGAKFDSSNVSLSGNYGQVEGFVFEGRGVEITGNYNRVGRNLFRNGNGSRAIFVKSSASYNLIDYNEITNWNGYQVHLQALQPGMYGNIVRRNYFHDNTKVSSAEAIKIGAGRVQTFYDLGTLVEYNLFDNIATDEENELISVKTSGNTMQYNTGMNSADNVFMGRHGINNIFRYNYFINIKLRVIGDYHQIIGNHLEGEDIIISPGDCIQDQVPTGGGCMPAAQYSLYENNFVYNGVIRLGSGSRQYPAKNNTLVCNQATIQDEKNHVGTQILPNENCRPDQTILLTPDMVGPFADLNITPTPLPSTTPTSSVNQAPKAINQQLSTSPNQAVEIQLTFDDDGPGPYTYTITKNPSNGTLTGSSNDRTYTPNSGFTGIDSFQWKVNDSEFYSNIATITINVQDSLVSNLSVKDTTNAANWSIQENLQPGAKQYGDRNFTLSSVPDTLLGNTWIQTANDSKSFTGAEIVNFKVNSYSTVYVAHNDRISSKPSWLSDWENSGISISNSEPRTFTLFSKDFSANSTVSLGSNGDTSNSMFTAIIKGRGITNGDGNGDQIVDGQDFIIWLIHFGQNVSGPSNGDYNDSGDVETGDYTIWINNYGS